LKLLFTQTRRLFHNTVDTRYLDIRYLDTPDMWTYL